MFLILFYIYFFGGGEEGVNMILQNHILVILQIIMAACSASLLNICAWCCVTGHGISENCDWL